MLILESTLGAANLYFENNSIVLYSAVYPGYLGCSSDVLPLLHAACSGRSQCEYPVPSTELDQTKPCFHELKTFLEVEYKCVKGNIKYIH